MDVTLHEDRSDRAACMAEVERIVASPHLRGSEALCKMLRYLAGQSFAHPGTPPKEYQIATELFGRPPDFDPQSDSTTRVQAGRLRTKLGEYYASEGAEDPIVVDIPKGSYKLVFHTRGAFPTFPQVPGVSIAEVPPKAPSVGFWRAAAGILALLLVATGALAMWSWLVARGAKHANAVAAER